MQVAESDRSDIGFVGMIIRCRDQRTEPVIVFLEPLPPRTKAAVEIEANGATESIDATLIPTGTGVALAIDIADRLATVWRNETELGVVVKTESGQVKGVISLRGLATSLPAFAETCRQSG